MYCLFCDVLCIVCVYMCTELLQPGGYPIAVKYISYHIKLMLYREIIAVCSEIHTKHINALWGEHKISEC